MIKNRFRHLGAPATHGKPAAMESAQQMLFPQLVLLRNQMLEHATFPLACTLEQNEASHLYPSNLHTVLSIKHLHDGLRQGSRYEFHEIHVFIFDPDGTVKTETQIIRGTHPENDSLTWHFTSSWMATGETLPWLKTKLGEMPHYMVGQESPLVLPLSRLEASAAAPSPLISSP